MHNFEKDAAEQEKKRETVCMCMRARICGYT